MLRDASPRMWIRYGKEAVRPVDLAQVRVEHFADSVPWRTFRSRRGQVHLSGRHWCATTGGHVVYESRLELARLLLADFDPAVVGVWAQPCRLDAPVDGRARKHVPDLLLTSRTGAVTVVNVKPADRLVDPAVAQALDWPGRLFEGRGWRYEVWSDCDPVMLDNIRFLAAYRRPGIVNEGLVRKAWERVVDGEPLAAAERRLAGDSHGYAIRPALLALLWQGRLTTDLTRPLSGASTLRRHQ